MIKRYKVYYIGFSPINGICNELFFEGSITMYPNNEKGNIFLSNQLIEDDRSDVAVQKFRQFVFEKVEELLSFDPTIKFLIFNDKERTKQICSFINKENIIPGNSFKVLEYLNNKEKIRTKFQGIIPMLDYNWKNGYELDTPFINNVLKQKGKIVVQGEVGAGGNNTYLIQKIEDFNKIEILNNTRYCLSEYKPNTPINITIVVGKDIILFPMSVQLIKNENGRFIYKGADFTYPKHFDSHLKKCIREYSLTIANKVKDIGYRGILGIDFIVDSQQNVYFMELNPRFQASSFYLSRRLESLTGFNLAFLHYLSLINERFPKFNLKLIDEVQGSFLNCNSETESIAIPHDSEIRNGYFPQLKASIYRKLYNASIVKVDNFEKTEIN